MQRHRLLPHHRRQIQRYDFRRPNKFSKEQLRTLHMLHESFARMFSTTLSAHLRMMAQVTIVNVKQLTYGELIGRVKDPAILAVLALKPLEGNILLHMDNRVAFLIVDRMFGGPGRVYEEVRSLTEIEQSVIERVLDAMCLAMREAWETTYAIDPSIERVESNAMFTQIVTPGEICANLVFEVQLGDQRGHFQLCLPFLVLEPILPQLSTQQWFASKRGSERRTLLQRELGQVAVALTARLGTARLTIRDLLALSVGDVIPLSRRRGEAIELYIGDRPKFKAMPGRRGQKLAVQVTGVLQELNGGDGFER